MVFVKVVKNRSYFRRFQVPYRRRREGRTDYAERRRLINQDQNKYNAPKYRFVVRRTNKRIICQIIYATIQGDRILCAAESVELARYGVRAGYTNYAAAYATGLLLARRLLKQLGMDQTYQGLLTANGEEFHVEDEQGDSDRRPFKASLDLGLVRATTGNRAFGAMKGACDGGLHIPHSSKRFPGYSCQDDKESYDASVHCARIYGDHVADYMRYLEENDPERLERQFSVFRNAGITADDVHVMYQEAHSKIRANPERLPKPERNIKTIREGNFLVCGDHKLFRPQRLTKEQRRDRVQRKLQIVADSLAASAAAQ